MNTITKSIRRLPGLFAFLCLAVSFSSAEEQNYQGRTRDPLKVPYLPSANDSIIERKKATARFLKESKWEEAIEELETMLHLDGKLWQVYPLLAELYFRTKRFEHAIKLGARWVLANPSNPSGYIIQGDAFQALQRYEEAIAAFGKALDQAPQLPLAIQKYNAAMTMAGEIDQALERFKTEAEKNPKTFIFHHSAGTLSGRQGAIDEAIKYYNNALRIESESWSAHYNLGICFMSKSKLDLAVGHMQKAIKINPNKPGVHNSLGLLYLRQKNYKQALESFESALGIKRDYFQARKNMAMTCILLRQGKAAAHHLREAIRLRPKAAAMHYHLGTLLLSAKRLEEARYEFREALRLNPNFLPAYYYLGLTQALSGQNAKAIQTYRLGLECDPQNLLILNNLAWMLATQKDPQLRNPDQAIELAQEAVDLSNRKRPGLLDTLSKAYSSAGKYDEAIEIGIEALSIAQNTGKDILVQTLLQHLVEYEKIQAEQTNRSKAVLPPRKSE